MQILVKVAVGYAVGVGFGLAFPGRVEVSVAAAGLCLLGMVCGHRICQCAWMLAAILCGYARVPDVPDPPAVEVLDCERVLLAETSEESTTTNEERVHLRLIAASACRKNAQPPILEPATARLALTVKRPPTTHLPEGTLVLLQGRLRPVLQPRNPGQPRTEPETLAVSIQSVSHLAILSHRTARMAHWLAPLRQKAERYFTANMSPSTAALARALCLGQASAVPSHLRLAFRRTGTAHLLAVSGLHLSIAALATFSALAFGLARIERLARRFDTGRFAAAGAMAMAGAYAYLSGGQLPAMRALIMIAAVLGSRLLHRPASGKSGLAAATIGILAADPTCLATPSFQLSFGAAAVLVLFLASRPPAKDSTISRNFYVRLCDALWRIGKVSLAATAITTPIALWHFHELSLVAVPINLVAVPIAGTILVPALLLCCALTLVWPAAAALPADVCEILIELLTSILEGLSNLPVAVSEPNMVIVACAVSACLCALALVRWPSRATAASFLGACVLCAIAVAASDDAPPHGQMTLDVLDVGHGDSLLLTAPSGEHVLIDGGGSTDPEYDTGERIVVPALRALGVSALHGLIVTHQDQDHAGGVAAVLRRFSTQQLWHNGATTPGQAQAAAIAEATRNAAVVLSPPTLCGTHRLGDLTVRVLHPCGAPVEGHRINDQSLVLLVEHAFGRLLLLGDAGQDVERTLVKQGLIPRVDVLKVAHHGSRTSTTQELLEAARPRFAVVSEPRYEGRIGLHRETRRRLLNQGVVVLSTQTLGALRITLDALGIGVRPL